jgi:hypothetical protein
MTEFKRGQRIRVVMESTVERVYSDGRITFYAPASGFREYVTVDTVDDTLGVLVEVMDPPNWPPQVGDVWEADGKDFYVRQYQGDGGSRVIEEFNYGFPRLRYTDKASAMSGSGYLTLADFKGLNPVLVRRREG